MTWGSLGGSGWGPWGPRPLSSCLCDRGSLWSPLVSTMPALMRLSLRGSQAWPGTGSCLGSWHGHHNVMTGWISGARAPWSPSLQVSPPHLTSLKGDFGCQRLSVGVAEEFWEVKKGIGDRFPHQQGLGLLLPCSPNSATGVGARGLLWLFWGIGYLINLRVCGAIMTAGPAAPTFWGRCPSKDYWSPKGTWGPQAGSGVASEGQAGL